MLRLVRVTSLDYNAFEKAIRKRFTIPEALEMHLRYLDSEDDLITIACDDDLIELKNMGYPEPIKLTLSLRLPGAGFLHPTSEPSSHY